GYALPHWRHRRQARVPAGRKGMRSLVIDVLTAGLLRGKSLHPRARFAILDSHSNEAQPSGTQREDLVHPTPRVPRDVLDLAGGVVERVRPVEPCPTVVGGETDDPIRCDQP